MKVTEDVDDVPSAPPLEQALALKDGQVRILAWA
jgi:hypothetical protein